MVFQYSTVNNLCKTAYVICLIHLNNLKKNDIIKALKLKMYRKGF